MGRSRLVRTPPGPAELLRYCAMAIVTTIVVAIALLLTVDRGSPRIVSMLAPGAQGPSAAVFRHDFPNARLPAGVGHDGQQFYAIARQPMHPTAAAPDLDRPRYRLQRILFPAVAWMVEPQGGGTGLAIAMYVIAALGVALMAIASAVLARLLGASSEIAERIALLFPLLPIALASLDITCPDALALGLVLLAFALDVDGKVTLAVLCGVLAVLTRESALLLLAGWVLARGRRALPIVAVPAAVGAGWWLILRATVAPGRDVKEFDPLFGLADAARTWSHGHDLFGALSVVAAIVLGLIALRIRGIRSPLGPAILLQLLFLPLLALDVIGPNYNAPRASGPLLALALVAIAVPRDVDATRTSSASAASTHAT